MSDGEITSLILFVTLSIWAQFLLLKAWWRVLQRRAEVHQLQAVAVFRCTPCGGRVVGTTVQDVNRHMELAHKAAPTDVVDR